MLYADFPGTPLSKMNISQITHEACKEAEMYLDAGIVRSYAALKFRNNNQVIRMMVNTTLEIRNPLPLYSLSGRLDN